MTECPACGCDTIFVARETFGVDLRTKLIIPAKVEAFCNQPTCGQLFWWYPKSGRVTRRTYGRVDWRTS